ncbi:MAG: hypothetical protein SFU20_04865 [Chitinophagaceae bacterium]|nr:hypothetical protein [Chitinophagaceae bacterium]
MKIQEIKNRISVELNFKLITEGFVYKKSTNEFRRSTGSHTYIFSIDLLAWSDHYSINVRVYISERQVEDILEKILGKQRNRLTLGGDIATIKFSPDGKKVINQTLAIIILFEEDIAAAIETLYHYYVEIAKPFFDRYNSLESIDDIINSEPYDSIPAHVCANYDGRCMKGLIVAKLVNNPRYNELVVIYNDEMRETFIDFRQEAIENYCKVRDYLNDNELIL